VILNEGENLEGVFLISLHCYSFSKHVTSCACIVLTVLLVKIVVILPLELSINCQIVQVSVHAGTCGDQACHVVVQ